MARSNSFLASLAPYTDTGFRSHTLCPYNTYSTALAVAGGVPFMRATSAPATASRIRRVSCAATSSSCAGSCFDSNSSRSPQTCLDVAVSSTCTSITIRSADASEPARDKISHVEVAPDRVRIRCLALVRGRRARGRHAKRSDAAERSRHVAGQALGERAVRGIAAGRVERQYRDGHGGRRRRRWLQERKQHPRSGDSERDGKRAGADAPADAVVLDQRAGRRRTLRCCRPPPSSTR